MLYYHSKNEYAIINYIITSVIEVRVRIRLRPRSPQNGEQQKNTGYGFPGHL